MLRVSASVRSTEDPNATGARNGRSARMNGRQYCHLTERMRCVDPFRKLQSHAGNKPLIFQVVCTQNGTAVQKGLSWGVCAEVRRPLFWKDNEMKTMLNLLHHKDDHNNNGDGSSSGNGKV